MFIGAHTSIAGGFDKCIDRAAEMGSNCLMTFASSPRSLQFTPLSQDSIDKYLAKKAEKGIGPHFFHAPYLINLASDKPDSLQLGINLLVNYQLLSARIQGAGTIFHIGTSKNPDLAKLAASIAAVVKTAPDCPPLILENSAGQQNSIGSSFEDIKTLIDQMTNVHMINSNSIGVCLDTQHAFAAGYDIDRVLDTFDKIIGLPYLRVVHFNDSKTDFNSRVDRHANLGEGKIGTANLKKFLIDCKLAAGNCPLIMEVPGDGSGPGSKDIQTLKSLSKAL